ncbi:hypothetical protein ACWCQZ_46625 [Streptomyces sp. NPDC002285]
MSTTSEAPFRLGMLATALMTLAAGGCASPTDLSFTNDHRLRFTAPAHRALVDLPVELHWAMADFRVAAPGSEVASREAGYFALFLDRAPIKPSHKLAEVADSDRECRRDPQCPDEDYYADRGIFTTTRRSITLGSVPDLNTNEAVQLHTITVVLVDTSGRRIGESAWHAEFKLRKKERS